MSAGIQNACNACKLLFKQQNKVIYGQSQILCKGTVRDVLYMFISQNKTLLKSNRFEMIYSNEA